MEQKHIISSFFIGLFLFILYQLIRIFAPFFNAIFAAAILAFAFYPLQNLFIRRLPLREGTAGIMTTFLVVLMVVVPASFILLSLLHEAIELYQQVSTAIQQGKHQAFINYIRELMSKEWIRQFWTPERPIEEQIKDFALKTAQTIGNFSAVQLATLTRNLVVWTFNLFLTACLLFFFLVNGNAIYDAFFDLLPLAKNNRNLLHRRTSETFAAVIRGQLVTSLAQATLVGLTFLFLDLPLPFLFGFIAFLASLIPITGAATVWAPFSVYLLASGNVTKGIILAVIGTLVISTCDNFLKPILIGERTKLPIFLLFLGILGGMNAYGFTGLFLGPIVISIFFVLLDIYRKEYRSNR